MRCDVTIVGAGPSGSTLARLLGKLGYSTVILEKEKFPRLKSCGGLVSIRALRELDFDVKKVAKEVYREAKFFRPRGDFVEFSSDSNIAVGVSRDDFDNLLVNKAIDQGANFFENQFVRDISIGSEKVKIVTTNGLEVESPVIVGADGVYSTVARLAGIREKWKPNEVASCLVTEVHMGEQSLWEIFPNPILEFYFGISSTGYGWIFPKKDTLSIGVGTLLSEQKGLKNAFDFFTSNNPHLTKLSNLSPKHHLIPVGGFTRRLIADRTLLIGDAAGFVDPLYGEGIYYAIISAKEACRTLIDALNYNDYSRETLESYEENCENSIMPGLRYGYSFAKKVHYHPDFMLRFLLVDDKMKKDLISFLRGEITHKELSKGIYRRMPTNLLKMIFYR